MDVAQVRAQLLAVGSAILRAKWACVTPFDYRGDLLERVDGPSSATVVIDQIFE